MRAKAVGHLLCQMVELAKTSTYTRIFDVNAARFSAPQDMRAEIRAALAETGEAPATDADLINSIYTRWRYCYGGSLPGAGSPHRAALG